MANETASRNLRQSAARVLIVDDHDIARAGLRSMLIDVPGLELVGEARDGEEAISLAHSLQPDLVLMDVRMPGMDGMACTRLIKHEWPMITVLVVTMHDSPEFMLMALQAGASGYLLKDSRRDDLIAAIRQVLRGEAFLNHELVALALQQMHGQISQPHQRGAQASHLTVRELEVLRLLARGLTNRDIAELLTISPGTVKVHVERIISKLQVSDRTQAAVRAIELGLITLKGSK
ncbi:MAG: response regulator [Oscillochloridaceae bacterium umkhey_bin13]